MKTRAEQQAERSSVRINYIGGWGTGIYVAPDRILSCAHVVDDGTKVVLLTRLDGKSFSGRVLERHSSMSGDMMWPDLLLIEADEIGEPVQFTDEGGTQDLYGYGHRGFCELGESIRCELDGTRNIPMIQDYFGQPYLGKFKQARVPHGFSGGPVIHNPSCRCRGMIKRSGNPHDEQGGYYIPTSVIFAMLKEVRDMQAALFDKPPADGDLQGLLREPRVEKQGPDLPVDFNPSSPSFATPSPLTVQIAATTSASEVAPTAAPAASTVSRDDEFVSDELKRVRELWKIGKTLTAFQVVQQLRDHRAVFERLSPALKTDITRMMAQFMLILEEPPDEIERLATVERLTQEAHRYET